MTVLEIVLSVLVVVLAWALAGVVSSHYWIDYGKVPLAMNRKGILDAMVLGPIMWPFGKVVEQDLSRRHRIPFPRLILLLMLVMPVPAFATSYDFNGTTIGLVAGTLTAEGTTPTAWDFTVSSTWEYLPSTHFTTDYGTLAICQGIGCVFGAGNVTSWTFTNPENLTMRLVFDESMQFLGGAYRVTFGPVPVMFFAGGSVATPEPSTWLLLVVAVGLLRLTLRQPCFWHHLSYSYWSKSR